MNKSYIIRVMRLLVLFLFVGFIHVSANTYSQTVTLKANAMSLRDVFEAIRSQTGYTVIGYAESLSNAKPVTVNAEKTPLATFLREILSNQPVDFEIERKTILIKDRKSRNIEVSESTSVAQTTLVIGRVVDSLGRPLEGASIRVKNAANELTAHQTTSDSKGNFILRDVPNGSRIYISFLGYTSVEIAASGDVGTITLKAQSGVLESVTLVANTGYTTLPRERSTGSFSTVSGTQLSTKSGSMNVVDRLEGLVPGLAVNYGEGNDKFLLRGITSVNLDRSPLIVVDGVPLADFNDLDRLVNPADVKDITVLKDATAASIWGAQAANGVIVITTHSGSYHSDKTTISYQGSISAKGMPDHGYANTMSSAEFINTFRELAADPAYLTAFPLSTLLGRDYPTVLPHERIFYDQEAGTIGSGVADSRWDSLANLHNRSQIENYFYSPSLLTSHQLGVSGGNNRNRYYASFGYTRQNNYDRSNRDRYQLTVKEEWKLTDWLTGDLTANMAYEEYKNTNIQFPTSLTSYLPYALFADHAGNPLDQTYLYMTEDYREQAMANSGLDLSYVPLQERNHTKSDHTSLSGRFQAGLLVGLGHGLSLQSRGQFQKTMDDGYTFQNGHAFPVQLDRIQFTELPATAGGEPKHYVPITGGNYSTQLNQVQTWTFRTQLNYDNSSYAERHRINALAGFETRGNLYTIRMTETRGYDFQTQRYPSFDHYYLENTGIANAALPTMNRTGGSNRLLYRPLTTVESELRFVSLYANMAYSYDERFNLNGSLRYDRSNLFGQSSSSQDKPIWSLGASWHLHRESFFDHDWLSELTLRTTYGIGGNAPKPGLGGVRDLLYAVSNTFTQDLGPSYIVISPANNRLIWEETKILNIGLDFALVGQKLRGSLEYYDKRTSDLLGERPLDPTTGWTSAFGNLGDLYNRGLELTLNARIVQQDHFDWMSRFNFGYNKNRITRLKHYNTVSPLQKAASGFIEGYSAFSLFALDYAGLDENGNPRVYLENGNLATRTNELSLDDVYFQGSTQPLYYGGWTNTFAYKDWSLSALLVYNLGHVMRQELNTVFSGRLTTNVNRVFDQRWRQPGDEQTTAIPAYIPNDAQSTADRALQFYRYADINTVSASYIKLRDITLTYDFATLLSSSLPTGQLKMYAQANNVLIWAQNKSGIDPEYYQLSAGYRTLKMPAFYTFGLQISL